VNSNNFIYVSEPDRRLCDTLIRAMSRAFPDRRVMQFHSNRELFEATKKRRPCVLLISSSHQESDISSQEVIRNIMSNHLDISVYVILMGTRQELETQTQFIIDQNILTIPKAIRMPVLIEMIEGCFDRADLNKISFVQLATGDYLFKQGDVADALYVLKSGRIAIELNNSKTNKTVRVKEILAQEMLGEMSFVDRSARSASAVALEHCEVIKLELGDFKEYLDKQSIWVRLIINTIVQRLRESNEKILK
jgi:CRP/FNR family cyclic AMP-dependent transcriptional regulator